VLVYRINRIDAYPIYKSSLAEVRVWAKLNPGELQSWERIDAVEALTLLQADYDQAVSDLAATGVVIPIHRKEN
jgi:hypothetical protein